VAVEEFDRGPVLDAALIACGQAIEHYGIARYGAMVGWAK
jgi:ferritin-like metal-binding protein YciE